MVMESGFEATVSVRVQHRSGPAIKGKGHVLNYLITSGQTYGNAADGGVTFSVCPEHADPDQCGCDGYDDSVYAAEFLSADVQDPDDADTPPGS
jgi:hypothetical protein